MTSKISLVIPCYNILNWENGEKYLDDAIESLKNQSIGFENLEVVLVDDGSSDGTSDLIKNKYTEYKNIKPVILEKNSGSGIARHNGVKNATSDYVMFLDADDEYTSESCEVLYNAIIENNADIVCSNYITRLDGVNYTGFSYTQKYKEVEPKNLDDFQKQYALWARIFRKEVIEGIQIKTSVLDDSYFNFKAFLESKKVIYLNDFYSCIHNVNYESVTMKPSTKSITNAFNQIPKIVEMVHKYDENNFNIINDLFSMVIQNMIMFNFSVKDNKEIFKNLKKHEDSIRQEYDCSEQVITSPSWAKFVNFFVDRKMFSIVSILIRPVQMILSNRKVFNFLFVNLMKHEEYN